MIHAWDLRESTDANITFSATKGVGLHAIKWGFEFYLASAHNTMLKIWDCRLPKKALFTVKGAHSARITSLDWKTSDPDFLLSAG